MILTNSKGNNMAKFTHPDITRLRNKKIKEKEDQLRPPLHSALIRSKEDFEDFIKKIKNND